MFFALAKISIDRDSETSHDGKIMAAVSEKIRKRFRVSATCTMPHQDCHFLISFFAENEMKTTQKLDAIYQFIENEGVGRILSENSVVDHIDTLDTCN